MARPRIRTVKITSAPYTCIAIGTARADGGVPITALIGAQGTDFAPTTDTFTGLAITISIVPTAHTGHTARRFHTERCVVRAPVMVSWVAGGTAAVHTLTGESVEAVPIVSTAYADIAIVSGHTEGRVPCASRIIRRITGVTTLSDTLPIGCLTITISRTADTASILAVDRTDGCRSITAGIVHRIAEHTALIHALLSAVAVSVSSTPHAAVATGIGHT